MNNNIKGDLNSLSDKKLFNNSDYKSTEQSSKSISSKKYKNNSIFKRVPKKSIFKSGLRKDLYGNVIEKGGKYKVSFVDDIKGEYLVEMTIYHADDCSLKSKNSKNYTIKREARDKEGVLCSGCNIF